MLAIDLLRESQGKMMCCEMQRECSSRATLPEGLGCGVVGGPLNSRLRAVTEVGKARDWPEAVKTHGGPKQPRKQGAVAVAERQRQVEAGREISPAPGRRGRARLR